MRLAGWGGMRWGNWCRCAPILTAIKISWPAPAAGAGGPVRERGMPSHGDGPCTGKPAGVVQPDDHDHGGAGKSCDGMTRTATMEAI